MEDSQQYCRNCRAPVTGEYCASCGQREGRADKRFLDLAGELLGDVFDMDSRFWRTLACLLLRPGFLSAEFIAGRRARYLPPLRLYLVISFVVFLWMSIAASGILSNDPGVVVADSDGVADTSPSGVCIARPGTCCQSSVNTSASECSCRPSTEPWSVVASRLAG